MADMLSKLGKAYGGNWELVDTERFTEEDAKLFKSATVVASDYGKSICFVLASGNTKYFKPCSNDSNLAIGEVVDVSKLQMLTLKRDGEVIYRIKEVNE